MKFDTDDQHVCQMSLLRAECQNCQTENLSVVIAQRWFKMCLLDLTIWATASNFGMKCDPSQNSSLHLA